LWNRGQGHVAINGVQFTIASADLPSVRGARVGLLFSVRLSRPVSQWLATGI